MSGYDKAMKVRSLMSASDGYFTCLYDSAGVVVRSATFVWNGLRNELDPRTVDSVRGMSLLADSTGAAFDLPVQFLKEVKEAAAKPGSQLKIATELPELQVKQQYGGYGGGGGYGRNRFQRGGRGGRGRFGGGGNRFGGGRRGGRGRGGRGGRGRGGRGRRW